MDIQKYTGTTNTSYKANRALKYIVLHYTAGTNSKSGAAKNVASMFKAGSVGGSADFIVDDANIVQYNGDIKNRYCWAVGGNKYPTMTTSLGGKLYGIATNTNCISIEMCSNKTNKKSLGDMDSDWYLSDATLNNAITLTKYLIQTYKIPVNNVIMHHQITGKHCPNPWVINESRLNGWYNFKKSLEVEDMTEAQTKTIAKAVAQEVVNATAEKVYNTIDAVPDFAKPTIKKLIEKGCIKGNEKGNLDLPYSLCRTLVILDRAKAFD